MTRLTIPSLLLLVTLCGCAEEDLAHATPIARSNILKPEFTTPHAGTTHVTLYRVPETLFTRCDATVQLSFHSVPGGRIADVAKMWPRDRLDMYLDPGDYRLNVYSAICGTTPTDLDLSLKAGEALTYRLFTGEFNMTLEPEPPVHQ